MANPTDERYWSPVMSVLSATGIRVTAEIALGCSCLYQGVRVIAETIGSSPLQLFRDLGDDPTTGLERKEKAKDSPLWSVLRDEPNGWQTSQEFRELMTAQAILWNNAIAEIIPGPRGAIDALVPLDPERVTIEQLPSRRLRYQVLEDNGTERTLVQDQVMHLRGIGIHRFVPAPLLTLAREAIGLWTALEKFEALFFQQGARPGIVAQHKGRLSDPAYDRLKADIEARVGGLRNMHRPFLFEEGMELKTFGFGLRDAQATESRAFMVQECARWLNMPEHMLRASKTPTFASIEQFAREFVDYTIRPLATKWEGVIKRDLVIEPDVYAKFNLDVLLRGHALDRANVYGVMVSNGIFTRNECRVLEDKNPLPGLDEPLTPLNMDRGGKPEGARPRRALPAAPDDKAEPGADDDDEEEARSVRHVFRLELIAQESAETLLKRETERVRAQAVKLSSRGEEWHAWIEAFYGEEWTIEVTKRLQVAYLQARDYAARHRASLREHGVAAIETWTVDELLTLVHEEGVRR